ncbi:unnamed protein product [Acanthoscelides obtectus]|uniref:DUF4806 domain-containing protein n=1 Tax=Acanthoscelides obtectus TaxID=200917 RepID=A0A9P0MGZ5_ACAOB|nr:unnamed protein product [Acanthoscelides obtectus]CAK1623952.1 hypothetical protein AOBTE_LOCUS2250 [Acanthoscelides obtectus]
MGDHFGDTELSAESSSSIEQNTKCSMDEMCLHLLSSTLSSTNPANNRISLAEGTVQCKSCSEKDKIFKVLVQQGHILRGLVTETLAEVKQLKDELVAKKQTSNTTKSFFTSISLNFPLSSDEDVLLFENYLADTSNFNNAVAELVKIGGIKSYDFVARVAKLILSNELAMKYSWLGRKGKRKFSNMKIADLLIGHIFTLICFPSLIS